MVTLRRIRNPSIAAPIIIIFSINVGWVIMSEQYMEIAPHLALWPGVCLTMVVYRLNMFGDAVRDLLDPAVAAASAATALAGAGPYGAYARRRYVLLVTGSAANRVEARQQVALIQRLFEQPQCPANRAHVEAVPMDAPQALRICEILRAAREELGDDEILDSDQRGRKLPPRSTDRARSRNSSSSPDPANTMSSGHAGGRVNERHHPSPPYELRILDAQDEPRGLHGGCEPLRIVVVQLDGDVDVGAQTGHTVRDDCLGAEHVPAPSACEHRCQCGQEFNCGGWKRHG